MTTPLGTRLTIAGQVHVVIGTNGTGEIVSVTNPGRHCEIHVGVVPAPKDRRCRFTDDELAQLRAWTAARMPVTEQAARLGRTASSVINIRHRYGITARRLPCVECGARCYGMGRCERHYRQWRRAGQGVRG